MNIDKSVLSEENLQKIKVLNNPHVEKIVEEYVTLCKPAKVSVITDSFTDIGYIRQMALDLGEEKSWPCPAHDSFRQFLRPGPRQEKHLSARDAGYEGVQNDRRERPGGRPCGSSRHHGRHHEGQGMFCPVFLPGTAPFPLFHCRPADYRFRLRRPQRRSAVPRRI